ncbi:MAG: ribonuclease domain-containing protein [Eubacteriales bacterium]|nr:ribonuclease domain-containing protein [Eubacteriales bacterium]
MKTFWKQWRRALTVPLLCVILTLATACGMQETVQDLQTSSGQELQLLEKQDDQASSGQELQLLEEQDDQKTDPQNPGSQSTDSQNTDLQSADPQGEDPPPEDGSAERPDENGTYTGKEDVALYLHVYGKLPGNFITKKQAEKLGWSGGSLEKYAPGMCIGGDKFKNYEGNLPDGSYHECDINTLGKKSRGAERLVYSDDGRIYYTGDHYKTFTLLYGEE